MQIQPVPGRLVRDPATGREITQPTEVPDSEAFWLRRIADGDVSAAPTKPATPATTKGADK